MRPLHILGSICFLCASALAADKQTVKLPTTRLADSEMVLSAGSLQLESKDRPIVYYRTFGTELILPSRKLVWENSAAQELHMGSASVKLSPNAQGMQASISGAGDSILKASGLGTQDVGLSLGGGDYAIAFPRVFTCGGRTTAFYRAATARVAQIGTQRVTDHVAQIGTQRITLYDDNMDGTYTAGPDGICVGDTGKISIFAPLAQLVGTPAGVYRVEDLAADGSQMAVTPHAGPAGKLAIKLAVPGLECRLALASEDGSCSTALLVGDEPVALAAGKYKLLYGILYNPTIGRAAALLGSGGITIPVTDGQTTTVTLGESLRGELESSDSAISCTFDRALELDLSPIEQACAAGDFAKAGTLLVDATKTYGAGPNYQATRAWFDDLGQRLKLESTSEAAALREAQNKALDLIRKNDLAGAKPMVAAAADALKKIPAAFQDSSPYFVHKARTEALARYVAVGGRRPGLAVTYYGHQFSGVTGQAIADRISWEGDPRGAERTQFFCIRYEGFLIVPQDGSYELALVSDEGARMLLDGEIVIDHFKPHTQAEKTVTLRLTAGPHALRINYFQYLGPAMLQFRWTPPGGRKGIVPPWALESSRSGPTTAPAPVMD